MSTIDIRNEDTLISRIVFADVDPRYCWPKNATILVKDDLHSKYVFMHNIEDFIPIRKIDIPDLIKALEKVLIIWNS